MADSSDKPEPDQNERRRGRPRTGTIVRTRDGRLQAIVTLADGKRKRLPPFPRGMSKAMAREKAIVRAGQAAERDSEQADPNATAGSKWWDAYFGRREGLGFAPTRDAYNQGVKPVLGDKHPREWTRDDCEAVVTALDAKVREGAISWKTAHNRWAFFTKACKVASSAKKGTGLRVRADNPCAGVEGPDRGVKKRKQWLYPVEFEKLMACPEVPLRWRRMYAILAYAYVRPGELKALDAGDVSLDAGKITINEAWDRARRRRKTPKTAAGVRRVPIEPELRALLRALLDEHKGEGPLFPMPPAESWASTFREHLERAEIDRPELFADTLTHKQITLYDLRASGITWRALRKDYGPAIQRDAGHEKFDTTLGYIREADAAGDVGAPFPPLPRAVTSAKVSIAEAITERGVKELHAMSETITGDEVSEPPRHSAALGAPCVSNPVGDATQSAVTSSACVTPEGGANEIRDRNSPEALATDPVETALADALTRAALAGAWDSVSQLTAELKARREARARVVSLDAERSRRGKR